MRRFRRLVFTLASLLTLVLVAMFGVWFYSESHRVEEQMKSDLRLVSHSYSAYVQREVESLDEVLREIRFHIQAEDRAGLELEPYVTDFTHRLPLILDVLVLNERGQILHTTAYSKMANPERLPFFLAQRQQTKDGLFIDVVRSGQAFEGAWFFAMSRPLYDRMGVFSGVVAVLVSVDVLNERLNLLADRPDIDMHLLYADGTVMAHIFPKENDIGAKEPQPKAGRGVNFGEQVRENVSWLISMRRLDAWPLYVQVGGNRSLARQRFSNLTMWVLAAGLAVLALLWAFLWAILRQHRSLQHASRELQDSYEEIQVLHEKLKEQSVRDPLTGLYNRIYLNEILPQEVEHASRLEQQLTVVMVDLDHFKHVNDTWVHVAGDEALRAMSKMLNGWVNHIGLAGRFGGEEFIVVLPNMSLEVALPRAESWRVELESTPISICAQQPGLNMTASFGMACFPRHGKSISDLIECADKALYSAKRQGRNRIQAYGPSMSPVEERPPAV